MRTVYLILATLLVLGVGFGAYLFMQGTAQSDHSSAPTQHTPQDFGAGESAYSVRGGKDVWLKTFDEDHRVTNQFRAAEFNPQKEGFVRVSKPEAQFFMRNGQWIRVTGETGDVVVAGLPEAGSDPFSSGRAAAPSRGRLQNVHIQLYDTPGATTSTIDMDMNNAAFNNETFQIFTEGYTDESGKNIPADQVKVTVRGKYEFDGRGLTIQWNDLDGRLELLEIAHGERLVVKDPGELGMKGAGPQQKADAAAIAADPIQLASADPKAGVAAAAASQPESTIYSIFFHDNVQVVQAEKTLATGNVIEVFYAMRNSQKTAPQTQTSAALAPEKPKTPEPPASQPTATTKATKPSEVPEPITIYWTGKLRIIPSTTEPPARLPVGESAIQMRGLPCVLTRDNVQIRCPGFTYLSATGGVTLDKSEVFPNVEIKQFQDDKLQGKPTVTLISERVEYAPDAGVATLIGKSRALFPADQNDPESEPAVATWTRQGQAHFTGTGNDTLMRNLELQGDVDVQHPQLSMKSQRLNLEFAEDKTMPAKASTRAARPQQTVTRVIADDAVHCVIIDEKGNPRELNGDHLDIETAKSPDGNLYPRVVNARGNVVAKEQDQTLNSDELAITLAPAVKRLDETAKPGTKASSATVELQKLVAKGNVRAVSKDGSTAKGDTLVVTTGADGKPQVGLSGKPAAVVNADGTVLSSNKIIIPNSDEAQTLGPGTLHAVTQSQDPKTPPRHVDVAWTDSATINMKLKEDQVQVAGKVNARMLEANGTIDTAQGERMLITLIDKPRPATKPARETPGKGKLAKNTSQEGTLAASNMDVMKDKEVSRILINKDAVVNSRLSAADGTVLREMQIDSSLLTYYTTNQRMIVPRAGRLLVRDHRPPGQKQTTDTSDEDGLSSQRGASAFQWSKYLDYNGSEKIMTMKGDVLVAYKPDEPGELPVRLRADELVATFEDAPHADNAKAGEAVPAAGDMKAPPVRLRSVRAEGQTNVVRGTDELSAPRLTYDPQSHWIRAMGTEDVPAVYRSSQGGTTTGREFQWNMKTWKVKIVDAAGRATGSTR